jgi:hypothetical protein
MLHSLVAAAISLSLKDVHPVSPVDREVQIARVIEGYR